MLRAYVIHFKALDQGRATVESLLASQGVEVSVTVVDNGGWTDTPDHYELLRTGNNLGFAGGANLALADVADSDPGTEWLVICCHDVVLPPDGLAALVAVADRRPDAAVVAPAVWQSGRLAGERVGRLDEPDSDGAVKARWVSGACMLVRRSAAATAGGFDERFGSYVEDKDLCLRLVDAGWNILLLPSVVGAGSGSSSPTWRHLMYRNQVLLARKRSGRLAALRLVLGHLRIAGFLLAGSLLSPGSTTAAERRVLAAARVRGAIASIRQALT